MHIAFLVGNHWGVYHQVSIVIGLKEQFLLVFCLYVTYFSPGLPSVIGSAVGTFLQSFASNLFR